MISSRRLKAVLPLFYFLVGYFVHDLSQTSFKSNEHLETSSLIGTSQLLVIFVFSAVPNYERRQTIRDTWASDLRTDIKLYFVISGGALVPDEVLKLLKEDGAYDDLLILHGVEDNFLTLTQKGLVALSWLTNDHVKLGAEGNITRTKPFNSFEYLLKCDDDSYVRPNEILTELRSTYKSPMLYWGFFDGKAKVKKSGKYKELKWDICDSYLPYALGGGYVLGCIPVKFIARNAQEWRRYNSEDTSVGAWLANLEGIDRRHDPRFDTEYLSRGCHQSYLVTHKMAPADMRRIHQQLVATGMLCHKEYRTRLSYRYDWSALPSKCCQRNNPNIP